MNIQEVVFLSIADHFLRCEADEEMYGVLLGSESQSITTSSPIIVTSTIDQELLTSAIGDNDIIGYYTLSTNSRESQTMVQKYFEEEVSEVLVLIFDPSNLTDSLTEEYSSPFTLFRTERGFGSSLCPIQYSLYSTAFDPKLLAENIQDSSAIDTNTSNQNQSHKAEIDNSSLKDVLKEDQKRHMLQSVADLTAKLVNLASGKGEVLTSV